LQAVIAAVGNDDPAVGYSVAYPFGVAGPILFLYLAFAILKPKINVSVSGGMELLEVTVEREEYVGKRLVELMDTLPAEVQVAALRRFNRNQAASPDLVLEADDTLLVVAPNKALLEEARKQLGEAAPGRVVQDRQDLDYLRVFVSRPSVVGTSLGAVDLPGEKKAVIVQVRRGDSDLVARSDVVLEFGDRVGLLAHRADFAALRKYFGDSIRGTAEFSYISIGLGLALGLLIGAISIRLPGVGSFSLGLSGVLVVALILGRLGRGAGLNWTLPASANLVLRNLGLTLFLAQVGMASGPKFAAAVAESGLLMLGLGAIALVGLIVPIFVLGLWVFRMPYEDVAGVVAGACGNPAILAYANKLAPNERPDLGYAIIFPGMTLVKILFVSVAPAFL
jgi:putative transport protein